MVEAVAAAPRQAEAYRHAGNELYRSGRFEAAALKYSQGLEIATDDHRLLLNRAACYAAQRHWSLCSDDALRSTQLKPDHPKGWLLFAKALWKGGSPIVAKHVLAEALQANPGEDSLLALNAEIDRRCGGPSYSRTSSPETRLDRLPAVMRSRSVSSASSTTCDSAPASPRTAKTLGSTPSTSRAPSVEGAGVRTTTPPAASRLPLLPAACAVPKTDPCEDAPPTLLAWIARRPCSRKSMNDENWDADVLPSKRALALTSRLAPLPGRPNSAASIRASKSATSCSRGRLTRAKSAKVTSREVVTSPPQSLRDV